MFRVGVLVLALCHLLICSTTVLAQTAPKPQIPAQPQVKKPERPAGKRTQETDNLLRGQSGDDANAGTVTIMTNRALGGAFQTAALDLSTLLDEGERFEKMRIIPVIARGKMQNLWDILYLRGIDLGFLQTDTLEYLKDDPQFAAIRDKLRYICIMFPEEIYFVGRNDIKSLQDLQGKKVSINAKGTAASVTAPIILRRLGIKATLEYEDSNRAVERLKSGDLAAHVFLLAKPAPSLAQVKGEGLHILSIPFTEEFFDLYVPSESTSNDYPNLIPADQKVQTLAVGNLLAVFNWPESSERYRKIARFVDAFFSRFPELQKPGFYSRWKDVNLAAVVPGWTRFKPAQEWLDKHPLSKPDDVAKSVVGTADQNVLREKFNAFVAQEKASGSAASLSQDELYQKFLEWQKKRD
jgi:uncharacterized protein